MFGFAHIWPNPALLTQCVVLLKNENSPHVASNLLDLLSIEHKGWMSKEQVIIFISVFKVAHAL